MHASIGATYRALAISIRADRMCEWLLCRWRAAEKVFHYRGRDVSLALALAQALVAAANDADHFIFCTATSLLHPNHRVHDCSDISDLERERLTNLRAHSAEQSEHVRKAGRKRDPPRLTWRKPLICPPPAVCSVDVQQQQQTSGSYLPPASLPLRAALRGRGLV